MTTWQEWANAVLAGIAAPKTKTNLVTLQCWSGREKGTWPSTQWNNPLNTTEPWPGAYDSGAQPGAHDVKVYASLDDGVGATVRTLTWEPYYPDIVAALRHSQPAMFWPAAARSQLDTWGTGQGWLDSVPLQGDSPMEEILNRIYAAVFGPGYGDAAFATKYKAYLGLIGKRFDALDAAIAKLVAPAPAPSPDLTQLKADVAGIKAEMATIGEGVAAIQATLKAGLKG